MERLTVETFEELKKSTLECVDKLKEFTPGHYYDDCGDQWGTVKGCSLHLKSGYDDERFIEVRACTDDETDDISFEVYEIINCNSYIETENFNEFYKFVEENFIDILNDIELELSNSTGYPVEYEWSVTE